MDRLLERFTGMCRDLFGEDLVGVYLHGSLAMGCFNPEKSDIDLLIVVEEEPSDSVKRAFLEETVRFNAEAPEKGIELSIVTRDAVKPFRYPTPFVFHFSTGHLERVLEEPEDYVRTMKGTDKDLAAHVTITRRYGKTLYGPPIPEVFGEVSREEYLDSLWYDIESAAEDMEEAPVYVTLNLCRVLAYVREGKILSKKEGGEWGFAHVPEAFRPQVEAALLYYTKNEPLPELPEKAAFAEYMLEKIRAGK